MTKRYHVTRTVVRRFTEMWEVMAESIEEVEALDVEVEGLFLWDRDDGLDSVEDVEIEEV